MAGSFSEEQIAAVVAAQLEDGLTADDAAHAACTVGLRGVPPWQISASSARRYAGQARRDSRVDRPAAGQVFADVADAAVRRLAAVVERETRKLEESDDPDPEGVFHWSRAARELARASREVTRGSGGRIPPQGDAAGEQLPAPGFLDSLAAADTY